MTSTNEAWEKEKDESQEKEMKAKDQTIAKVEEKQERWEKEMMAKFEEKQERWKKEMMAKFKEKEEKWEKEMKAKDQEIKKMKKEMKAKDQDIKKMKKEKKADDQTIAKFEGEQEERSLGNFAKNFKGFRDETASNAHTDPAHEEAEMKIVTEFEWVQPHDQFWMYDNGSDLWSHHDSIDSEGCVVIRVSNLVAAVIRALGLRHMIHVVVQRSMLSMEFDLMLVLASKKLPIGCIEVKKPHDETNDDKIFGSGKVAGQLYDQLQTIRLGGLPQAFGIITTGNKWMLASTASLQRGACCNILQDEVMAEDTTTNGCSPVQPFHPKNDKKRKRGEANGVTEKGCCGESRVLYAAETIDGTASGRDMIKLIASAVLLMYESGKGLDYYSQLQSGKDMLARKIQFRDASRCTENFAFQKLSAGEINYKAYALAHPRVKCLYLLQPLGFGANGSACLAVSHGGAGVCVVKFYNNTEVDRKNAATPGRPSQAELENNASSSERAAQAELENWNVVYGDQFGKSLVATLSGGKNCLIMPYFWPIEQHDRVRYTAKEEGPLWDALCAFANKGKQHMDVRWRHVGWHPLTERVALFDLGEIENLSGTSKDEWVRTAFSDLKERCNDEHI